MYHTQEWEKLFHRLMYHTTDTTSLNQIFKNDFTSVDNKHHKSEQTCDSIQWVHSWTHGMNKVKWQPWQHLIPPDRQTGHRLLCMRSLLAHCKQRHRCLFAYAHACCANIHIYTQMHIIHAHIHAVHRQLHVYTPLCMPCVHVCIYMHICANTHTLASPMHTHTHTHTYAIYMHAHTHTQRALLPLTRSIDQYARVYIIHARTWQRVDGVHGRYHSRRNSTCTTAVALPQTRLINRTMTNARVNSIHAG